MGPTMSYQTYAVEFMVTERLGGAERSPPFSIDPSDPAFIAADPQNIRSFTVEELGVVDLSLVAQSPTVGVRFVPFVWIESPVFPDPPFGSCFIVDSLSLRRMRLAFIAVGTRRYFRNGIEVPRGASLHFDNWVIPPGRPLRLRIGIAPAESTLNWTELKRAFCCMRTLPDMPGGPPKP